MLCPKCHHDLRKVRWEITNNLGVGKNFKEYSKDTYGCKKDDVWITVEILMTTKSEKATKKETKNNIE